MTQTHLKQDNCSSTEKGPWSSGYDISLTRRKSPVRIWVGPLLLLLLVGCSSSPSLSASLTDSTIPSGTETRLVVTVSNPNSEILQGTIDVRSDNDNAVDIVYPDDDKLALELYEDESVTRVFTITASSDTRRTDYEIVVDITNETGVIISESRVLSVRSQP